MNFFKIRKMHHGRIEEINLEKGVVKIVTCSKFFNLPSVNFQNPEDLWEEEKIRCIINDYNRIKEIYRFEGKLIKKKYIIYKEHLGV